MFESLVNPKKAERRTWELFLIGLLYASLSVLLVNWIFSSDPVLIKYSGLLIVTFSVMFSLPFMYYTIKLEEEKDLEIKSYMRLLKEHAKALKAFMWLFLGFIIAFSFWSIVLSNPDIFRVQIETYCMINQPGSYEKCIQEYTIKGSVTGAGLHADRFTSIVINNIYVLIFTIIFSLIFGAGAIFILAWNASVIAAAIVIFVKSQVACIPLGLARYMIHGFPEILSYFTVALAGGIVSIAIIRHNFQSERFWRIMEDALVLTVLAIILLIISGFIEVYITPGIYSLMENTATSLNYCNIF